MRRYTPRKAAKRWLAEAPAYVLDVFDNGGIDKRGGSLDRYTVLFTGKLLITDGTFARTFVPCLGMSGAPEHPQGFSQWSELKAYQAAAYRYRSHHQRIRWNELPEHIQAHVRGRAEAE